MNDNVSPPVHRNESEALTYPPAASVPGLYAGDYGAEEEDGGPKLARILKGIFRRKWIIVLAAIAGAGGAFFGYRSVQPLYRADGAIWVNLDDRNATMAGPISQGGLLEQTAWIDLLKSFAVLEPVVIQERLYLSTSERFRPLFQGFGLADTFAPGEFELTVSEAGDRWTLATPEGVRLGEGVPGDSIGKDLGFLWAPPAASLQPETVIQFRILNPRDAALRLSNEIQSTMDRQGNFIRLGLTGTNPERITRVLTSLMEQHVAVAAELKKGKLDELTMILEEQLSQVQQELQGAESRLESFKVQTVTLPSEQSGAIAPGLQQTQAPVFSDYFTRRMELERINQDLERLQVILDSTSPDEIRVESFELIPAVQTSSQLQGALRTLTERRAELRSLEQRYTEDYQPVRDLQSEIHNLETITLPHLTRSLMAELQARATELRMVLATRATELEEIPPRVIEEARLERRVAIADRLYTDLRQRYETARLASASSIPDISILDHPRVPSVPASDQRIQLAGMIFLGFLGAGIAVAVLLDRIDPRFRYLSDVADDLGLEILGVVPRLESGRKENATQVFEAFRDIRMRCEFAHGTARPIVIAVTSPDTGEGKTFVSANLAISFAHLGRATLLVDADTRRGDLHELFDHDRKPGLTELLEGRVRNSVIRRTQHENLDLLSSGSRRSASPELLSSGRMQQMLAALKPRYDVILLDCPPMAAGSDAFVLGAHCGNVLLVLRSGSTHKDLAKGKMETFLRLPVRILGGVMNDLKAGEGDFGTYKYYSYYLPEYVTREDEPEESEEELAPFEDPLTTAVKT
jgi:capsular exopolysaccharide synthesis family protein